MTDIETYYQGRLRENGFQEITPKASFHKAGKCYAIPAEIGNGVYWVYGQKDLYDIKIHDFYFYEDSFFDLQTRECLGICYYESISGEEISPYRRLTAGSVRCFIGGLSPSKMLVHKNIPVRTIDIEIMPAYYEKYLKEAYPSVYTDPHEAFRNISWSENFPEMIGLLRQIMRYRGEGIAARLFYDGKVSEALSLILEYNRRRKNATDIPVSIQDMQSLESVIAYINDHFNRTIATESLCRIACMGKTKFKTLFKQAYNCTVTEYIEQRRLSHAENLLTATDFTVEQIAAAIGYSNAGRFAGSFKKSTGLYPAEYRKMAKRPSLFSSFY